MSSTKKVVRSAASQVRVTRKLTKTTGSQRETVFGVSEEALKKCKITAFQTRVYALLQRIPKGFVTTYGVMAVILGSGPRAVGQAMAKNPFLPVVPCHRVITQTKNGCHLGNMPEWALKRKIELLRLEGILIPDEGTKVSASLVDDLSMIDSTKILDTDAFKKHLEAQQRGFDFNTNLDTSKSF